MAAREGLWTPSDAGNLPTSNYIAVGRGRGNEERESDRQDVTGATPESRG